MNVSLLKRPSAFLPILMSVIVIGIIVGHIAMSGTAREADEGTAAHLFQLLMAGQVPIIGFFAVTWLPREPRAALLVLGLQLAAAMAAIAPVWWLQW